MNIESLGANKYAKLSLLLGSNRPDPSELHCSMQQLFFEISGTCPMAGCLIKQ